MAAVSVSNEHQVDFGAGAQSDADANQTAKGICPFMPFTLRYKRIIYCEVLFFDFRIALDSVSAETGIVRFPEIQI
jgi:hypothetical protein